MKRLLYLVLLIQTNIHSYSQKKPEDFGYRHLQFEYQNLQTDILISSAKGEEQIAKPILFFCQGSLPTPLLITENNNAYGVFPFSTDIFNKNFHLIIAGKPGIPLTAESDQLNPDFTFTDSSGFPPSDFLENDYLEFYAERNNFILQKLMKENWVDPQKIVVAGHSAGATIAVKMAESNKKITHLIYASGNPFGRIVTMLEKSKSMDKDTSNYKENTLQYWEYLNQQPFDELSSTEKADLSFSINTTELLQKINIPALFVYGSEDFCSTYLDYLRVWAVQQKKNNFSFKEYRGFDHNFFGIDETGKPDYSDFNWDKVAQHWLAWLMKEK